MDYEIIGFCYPTDSVHYHNIKDIFRVTIGTDRSGKSPGIINTQLINPIGILIIRPGPCG